MNKTALIASAAFVGVVGLAAGVVTTWENYIKQIKDRFPELETKLIRKTYYKLMKDSFLGKYGDLSNMTDQQMDELFLSVYKKQTTSK